jgi:cytochrome P450
MFQPFEEMTMSGIEAVQDGNAIAGAPPAPGPEGHCLLGSVRELTADWLGYLGACEEQYGGIVRFKMPWPMKPIILVSDPSAIEQVLLRDPQSFGKAKTQLEARVVLGDGLVLAQGEKWRRLRRMDAPAFHRARIASYAEHMAACAEEMVNSWQHDTVRDMFVDANALGLRIVASTLFGVRVKEDAEEASRALGETLAVFDEYFGSRYRIPLSIPTPKGLRVRRASKALYRFVDGVIAKRRASGEDLGDLLSQFIGARDEDGSAFSHQELREEAMNMFVAGTETTSNASAWTLYLLARHPEIAARVRAEIDSVVGDAPLTMDNVVRLSFLEKVVKESLRLYPPAWLIPREALRDYDLGGYRIERGSQLFLVSYLVHHNRHLYTDPECFNPDRWTDELQEKLPRFGYMPFGGGKRFCIGATFALLDVPVVVAAILRKYELEATSTVPKPRPGFSLRPHGGVPLRVLRRREKAQAVLRPAPSAPAAAHGEGRCPWKAALQAELDAPVE